MNDGKESPEAMDRLLKIIEEDSSTRLRRLKIDCGVLGGLILFVFAYMTWIYGAIADLDPGQVTRLAGTWVEDKLPEVKASLREEAVRRAPELTEEAKRKFLELPHYLRTEMVEPRLRKEAKAGLERLETQLAEELDKMVDRQVALVETSHPGVDDDRRLDLVLEGMRTNYKVRMTVLIDDMYEGYSKEMKRLRDYFYRLQTSPNLTESEEIERQLIEVWLVLVEDHGITDPESTLNNPR